MSDKTRGNNKDETLEATTAAEGRGCGTELSNSAACVCADQLDLLLLQQQDSLVLDELDAVCVGLHRKTVALTLQFHELLHHGHRAVGILVRGRDCGECVLESLDLLGQHIVRDLGVDQPRVIGVVDGLLQV